MNIDLLSTQELTEVEVLRGQIISIEQEKYLKRVFTELTMQAAIVDLSATPTERQYAEICRAFDGGKRAFIEELLTDSESAKAALRQLDNPNQT